MVIREAKTELSVLVCVLAQGLGSSEAHRYRTWLQVVRFPLLQVTWRLWLGYKPHSRVRQLACPQRRLMHASRCILVQPTHLAAGMAICMIWHRYDMIWKMKPILCFCAHCDWGGSKYGEIRDIYLLPRDPDWINYGGWISLWNANFRQIDTIYCK